MENQVLDRNSYLDSIHQFDLYDALAKMVSLNKISVTEMEELLRKSGLSKIKAGHYKNELGNILIMNVKQ